MAKNLLQYDLLISCPSDAAGSVRVIKEVVDEFNQQFNDVLGISIRCRYWKDSAYAQSGGKPQDLLNKQIVETSDLAIAIFKNKFGSPTEKFGSGTEEEIEKMLSEGKQVFVFFDESPVSLSEVDGKEYDRVQAFKDKYKDKGIYWTYQSEDEFKNIFRAHVTKYFLTLSNDTGSDGKPNLVIRAYRNGRIEESFHLSLFDMGGFISSDKLIDQIRDRINQINEIKLVTSKLSVQTSFDLFAGKKVEIENSTIDIIKLISDKMGIELDKGFFDVGNLTESPVLSNISFGGRNLNGTREEKDKYNAIISLKEMIITTTAHKQMEQYYKDLYGIELILCNDGTRFDEDIDVEIVLPADRYIDVGELPVPSGEVNLGDDWCFEDIFEIPATKDFISYRDAKKPLLGMMSNHFTPVNPFMGRDYEEEYRGTLRDIFEYQIYPDGKDVIVKVHFDYIKQHQCVAFPTWIFIKRLGEGLRVKYTITTKNNISVIERYIDIIPSNTLKDVDMN